MISMSRYLISLIMSRVCMAPPIWKHIGINNGYQRSVAAVVVAAVVKAVVNLCVAAVMVVKDMDET